MKRVYLLHGFNVEDGGEGTIGSLRPYLEAAGYDVHLIDYGYMFRARVRLCNDNIARMLASTIEQDSIVIAHSNGCTIAHKATYYGAPISNLIYFNPALDNELAPDRQVNSLDVFYSPNDAATSWASWIPFSEWGSMGSTGFKGIDSRVANINEEDVTGEEMGHSDFAKYPDLFGNMVVTICTNY